MTDPYETIGRYASRATAFGAVLLVAATATASAQPHGGSAGGSIGGWGAFGGWMFLWPVVLLGLQPCWSSGPAVGAGAAAPTAMTDPTARSRNSRERYARGELSEEEFERRRRQPAIVDQ